MKPGTWSTAYRSNRPSHCDDLRLPAGDTLRSVWHAGNRCHFVLLDKDESCPTVDLSNTGRPSGPDYSTGDGGELLNRPPILAQNRDFYLPHLHSMPPFLLGGGVPDGILPCSLYGKTTEWLGYTRWWNIFELLKIRLFVLTECTNVTDTHTDTAWRLRTRLHSIARQKRRKKRLSDFCDDCCVAVSRKWCGKRLLLRIGSHTRVFDWYQFRCPSVTLNFRNTPLYREFLYNISYLDVQCHDFTMCRFLPRDAYA